MSRYLLIAGLTIATTVASLGNGTTVESASKPLTVTQAAKEIAKKQKSCYKNYNYKKVSATIKISAKNTKDLKAKTKSISKKVKSLTKQECYETCKTDFTVTKTGKQKLKAGSGTATVKKSGKTWTVKYSWMAGNSKYANQNKKPTPTPTPGEGEETPGSTNELSASEKKYAELIKNEIKELTDGKNDFVKVALIGEWIQTHYTYGYVTNEKPYLESWYTGEFYGICSDTAAMTKSLCDIVGVKCAMVTSEKQGHARNVVEINGERFYVDCGMGVLITEMDHKTVVVAADEDGKWYVGRNTFIFNARTSFIQDGVLYMVWVPLPEDEKDFVYIPEEWEDIGVPEGVHDIKYLDGITNPYDDGAAADDYGFWDGKSHLDWSVSPFWDQLD